MKDFFAYFPTTEYALDEHKKKVVDITVTAIVMRYKIDSSVVLWKKEVQDGDTPVSLSRDIYSDPAYYWTILYINNIINPYTDWYMTQTQLETYVKRKYGSDFDKIKHLEWYDSVKDESIIMDDVDRAIQEPKLGTIEFPHNARAVTNVAWERRLNMERKFIQVISPQYIVKFEDMFNNAMNGFDA